MIFDSHTHVDVVEKWGWIDPPEAIIELMDEAQVEKAVVMTYRDSVKPDDPATLFVKEAVEKYPDRLVAYIRGNPNSPQAIEAFDQAMVDFKFVGLKLHTVSHVGFPYTEPALHLLRGESAGPRRKGSMDRSSAGAGLSRGPGHRSGA